jgi:hypothetical protein
MLYCLKLFGKKTDYSVKNHRIILINFWIIHIWCYFAFHILYRIRVSNSESDILIRRIPIYRIWILKYRFGGGFGTEIILSVYIPTYTHFNKGSLTCRGHKMDGGCTVCALHHCKGHAIYDVRSPSYSPFKCLMDETGLLWSLWRL